MRKFIAVALVTMTTIAAAQTPFQPGESVITDQNGSVYRVSRTGVVSSFVSLGTFAGGVDFDYDGTVLVTGASLWRVDSSGRITTIVAALATSAYEVDVGPRGNYWITSLATGTSVLEYSRNGTLLRSFATAQRPWGLGYDPQSDSFNICGTSAVYKLDRNSGNMTTLSSAGGLFLQSGHFYGGTFYAGDDSLNGMLGYDRQGVITTIWQNAPMADPGEGVDSYHNGDLLITDDSGQGGDSLFVVRLGQTPQLSTLVVGSIFSDLNCCAVRPEIVAQRRGGNPRVGQVVDIDVTSTGGFGEPFVFASSFSINNGIPLPGGRKLPLDPDALFLATAQNQLSGVFVNYQGFLDDAGRATLRVAIPPISALAGVVFYTAGVTIHPVATGGIHLVSESVAQVNIQP